MAQNAGAVAVELIAKVDNFSPKVKASASSFAGDMKRIEASADGAERAVARSMQTTERSMARAAQQSRNLGYQISDIGSQLAVGSSPFLILAQQGPQVANALDGARGAVGKFAGFLSGPWGAALLAGTTLLGGFIFKSREAGDGVDDLVEKLKEQARAAEDSERANELFDQSLEGVRKAARDAEKAIEALRLAKKGEAEQTVETIRAQLNTAEAFRATTRARLDEAKALLQVAQITAEVNAGQGTGGTAGAVSNIRLDQAAAAVEDLSKQLDAAGKEAVDLQRRLGQAISYRTIERETRSAEEAINARYDAQIDGAAMAADASDKSQAALRKEVAAIEAAREAELKRERDREQAQRRRVSRTRAAADNVTGAEVARALGTTINSGTRSAAQNRAAGGARNSYHLSGQAIDIPLTVAGKPLTKEGIRAALEPLGIEIKELLGPGDKGHNDHFHIAFAKNRLAPDQVQDRQDKAAEEIARAAREEAERLRQVAGEIGSLDDAILQRKRELADTAEKRLEFDQQAVAAAEADYAAQVAHLQSQGKVTEAEAKILLAKNKQIADLDRDLIAQRDATRARQEALTLAEGVLDIELDQLRDQEQLAETSRDRRRIALEIVDAEYEKLRLALEATLADEQATEAAKELARIRLSQLDAAKAGAQEGARRETASPLESYFDQIRTTGAALDDELEAVAAGGIQSVVDGLADIATGYASLGDVARNVLAQITGQLVRLAAQQLILQVIGKTAGQGAIAATQAQMAAVAASAAPAAAAVSLATLGANAGPASAGIAATFALTQALATAGSVLGRAGGGPIYGPGGPRDDRVPVMASPGEYMIRATSAAKLGRSTLDHLNRFGEVPGFRNGGMVRGPRVSNGTINTRGAEPVEMSESFKRELHSALTEAARAMPEVNLFPTLDSEAALQAALNRPGGRRALLDFLGQNSGAVNSRLSR